MSTLASHKIDQQNYVKSHFAATRNSSPVSSDLSGFKSVSCWFSAALEDIYDTSLDESEIVSMLKPFSGDVDLSWKAHYSFATYGLAKTLRDSPQKIASYIANSLSNHVAIDRAEAIAGYVNFSLSERYLCLFLDYIIGEESYPITRAVSPEKILIDCGRFPIGQRASESFRHAVICCEFLSIMKQLRGHCVVSYLMASDWGVDAARALLSTQGMDSAHSSRRMLRKTKIMLENGDESTITAWFSLRSTWLDELKSSAEGLACKLPLVLSDSCYPYANKPILNKVIEASMECLVKDTHSQAVYMRGEHPHALVTHEGHIDRLGYDIEAITYATAMYPAHVLYCLQSSNDSYHRALQQLVTCLGLQTNVSPLRLGTATTLSSSSQSLKAHYLLPVKDHARVKQVIDDLQTSKNQLASKVTENKQKDYALSEKERAFVVRLLEFDVVVATCDSNNSARAMYDYALLLIDDVQQLLRHYEDRGEDHATFGIAKGYSMVAAVILQCLGPAMLR